MRKLALLLLILPAGALWGQSDDGFIWIDANTRIKKPASASTGGTAPEKAPEKKEKKEEAKK